jgi:hypothetical protein
MSTANQTRQNMITRWLSPPDPSVNFNIARDARHQGTTVWFTRSGVFTNWMKSGSLLWIHGKRMLFDPLRDSYWHPTNSLPVP